MAISKQASSIIETLVFKVHDIESTMHRLVSDEEEKRNLQTVIDSIKTELGRFFVKHIDRRRQTRGAQSVELDYKGFFGMQRPGSSSQALMCKFCGESTVSQRRSTALGQDVLYCTTCKQESLVPSPTTKPTLRPL